MTLSFLEVPGLTIISSDFTALRSRPILLGTLSTTFLPLAAGATTLTFVGSEAGNEGLATVSGIVFFAAFAALLLSVLTFSNSSSSSLLLNP
jgi:hypothetical protein